MSISELRGRMEEAQEDRTKALAKASEWREKRDQVDRDLANGLISESTASTLRAAATAKSRAFSDLSRQLMQTISDLSRAINAFENADNSSSSSSTSNAGAELIQVTDQETAARAGTIYDNADLLFQELQQGLISETQFTIRIQELQDELLGLGWLPWAPKEPEVVEVIPPPSGGDAVDLTPLVELMRQQGELPDLKGNPELEISLRAIIGGSLESRGLNIERAYDASESPVNPEAAALRVEALAKQILGAVAVGGAVVIGAEVAGLGQLETPASIFQFLVGLTGWDSMAQDFARMPFEQGLIPAAERHYRSQFMAELPGSGDLVRFLVRETIGRDRFDQAMSEQGFSPEWTDAYWVSHWREISRRDVMDAFHRNEISADERDKFLVILDFRPDKRPGISRPDLEIIGSIGKTLIPRVDLRRAFKWGVLDFEDLVERYGWLGFEDDAPLMAAIQSSVTFEAEQNAVIREAGELFSRNLILPSDFDETYDRARATFDSKELYLMRYTLKKQRTKAAGEPGDIDVEELVDEAKRLSQEG